MSSSSSRVGTRQHWIVSFCLCLQQRNLPTPQAASCRVLQQQLYQLISPLTLLFFVMVQTYLGQRMCRSRGDVAVTVSCMCAAAVGAYPTQAVELLRTLPTHSAAALQPIEQLATNSACICCAACGFLPLRHLLFKSKSYCSETVTVGNPLHCCQACLQACSQWE